LLVAFGLRLFWIIIATRTPSGGFNDAFEYLRIGTGFSYRVLPTLNGRGSAFYAPGYPMVLAPFLLVARKTGWASPAEVASMVNLIAGTITVGATAFLADRWVSPRARNPAAWLMAVAPAHIYFTPTAHGETVFAAVLLSMVSWFTIVVERADAKGERVRVRWLVVFGLLAAFAVLIRAPGLALLATPPLVLRARGATLRSIVRAGGIVLVAAVVGLIPWTVVNGVNAGVWTPTSTQNATAICVGNHDLADGRFPQNDMPPRMAWDCYRYSPFDDPDLKLAPSWWTYSGVDEQQWYRASTLRGLKWAVKHPGQEAWLVKQKLVEAWSSEWDALPAGRNFEQQDWTGRATTPLNWIANGWLYLVEALAVAGLILSPSARKATPIWGSAVLITLTLVGGVSQPHFRHAAIPLLVILGSGAIAALGDRRAGGSDTAGPEREADDDREAAAG
jgi:hypothetical protein